MAVLDLKDLDKRKMHTHPKQSFACTTELLEEDLPGHKHKARDVEDLSEYYIQQGSGVGGDLAGALLAPKVVALSGDGLPRLIANGFLKRNAANNGWEVVVFGTGANTVAQGNDTRIGGSTPHAATHEPGGSDAMAVDAVAATGSLRTLGSGAQQAAAGNDSRFIDARTPTAHASTHQNGGSDEIATATATANAIPKAGGGGKLAAAWISAVLASSDLTNDAALEKTANKNAASGYAGLDASSKLTGSQQVYGTIGNTACEGNDSRLSNARTPTAHASTHKSGGSDAVLLDELGAPTDVTTLNATTLAHGLLPKLGGGTSNFLRADGAWAAPPAPSIARTFALMGA